MKKTKSLTKASGKRRVRGAAKGGLDLKPLIVAALRKEFPNDTIDISDGYMGNVHVLVISRRFDNQNESVRTKLLEEIIAASGITKAQQKKISLLLALSPGEIK